MWKEYEILERPSSAWSDRDEALLDALYVNMPAGRTLKRTSRGRFTALDNILIEEITKRFPGPLSVHDMAASSAVTSMELYQRLRVDRQVTMQASDYYDAVYLIGGCVFDAAGRPMKRGVFSKLAGVLHRTGFSRRVSLFHPVARALAASDQNFRLAREDMFCPGPTKYDVVRALNALTEVNFPKDDVDRALRAVTKTVRENGLLVLGCCPVEDNRVDAMIFVKEQGGLTPIRQVGSGNWRGR